jgi:hypothetical protein
MHIDVRLMLDPRNEEIARPHIGNACEIRTCFVECDAHAQCSQRVLESFLVSEFEFGHVQEDAAALQRRDQRCPLGGVQQVDDRRQRCALHRRDQHHAEGAVAVHQLDGLHVLIAHGCK